MNLSIRLNGVLSENTFNIHAISMNITPKWLSVFSKTVQLFSCSVSRCHSRYNSETTVSASFLQAGDIFVAKQRQRCVGQNFITQ
jgi:hypothetical protein